MAAAFNLPSVLLQPGAGALVDRLGAQRMLTAATVGYAACCAWFAFSGSASNATAARLVMGSFAAFLYPAFISVIARLVAAEGRQRAIGLMQMAIGFAGVSGSLLATPVLASDSWRLALGGPAFTALPLAIALWIMLAHPLLRGRSAAGHHRDPRHHAGGPFAGGGGGGHRDRAGRALGGAQCDRRAGSRQQPVASVSDGTSLVRRSVHVEPVEHHRLLPLTMAVARPPARRRWPTGSWCFVRRPGSGSGCRVTPVHRCRAARCRWSTWRSLRISTW